MAAERSGSSLHCLLPPGTSVWRVRDSNTTIIVLPHSRLSGQMTLSSIFWLIRSKLTCHYLQGLLNSEPDTGPVITASSYCLICFGIKSECHQALYNFIRLCDLFFQVLVYLKQPVNWVLTSNNGQIHSICVFKTEVHRKCTKAHWQ